MNKILVVIVIVLLALFAILIPIIPISVPVYQVLVMRGECASPALALRDSVLIFGSISVWISYSISHYVGTDFGVVYLPNGVPYSYDNSSFHFLPFIPPLIACPFL